MTTTEKVTDAKGVGGHLASGRSRHGYGEIKYDSGAFYVGGWSRGKREGTGKFVFACGDVYEGQWKNGMYHGVGKYMSADSDEYEGEWVNDKMDGHGRYHYRNSGDVYEGDWIGGVSHGIGKFIQASTGETFMGEYERGELKGKTKIDKASMLKGTDEFGKRIKFFTASLTGERAIRAGLGNFRYSGETIAHGDALTIQSKESVEGAPGGRLQGTSRGRLASGRVRHGYGEIKYDSGSAYVGEWEYDKRVGTGTYIFACGDVYEGQWKNGMYHGVGKYTSADSDEYEGEWAYDKMEGTQPSPLAQRRRPLSPFPCLRFPYHHRARALRLQGERRCVRGQFRQGRHRRPRKVHYEGERRDGPGRVFRRQIACLRLVLDENVLCGLAVHHQSGVRILSEALGGGGDCTRRPRASDDVCCEQMSARRALEL